MAGLIPDNILEDILSRVDIVELIAGYIPLKRAGRNFKAICPFHQEKTASFVISPDRQIYHCFGCGKGGNAFSFLMEYERMEFQEAVQLLAKKCGVSLPQRREDVQATSLYTQLYKINELANAFYIQGLNSPEGTAAKSYLLKRGIKEDSIKLFKLGFALDKWDALLNHLRAKNISLSLLEKAGLVLSKEGGGYYDRFRNRVIFPIFDAGAKTLGFGARILAVSGQNNQDNAVAKYVNSPETPIYTKGRHLYGLNMVKEAIRENDYVAVVEGYLDFIMPYQEGFKNIVASLGTALTPEQARLLKRYTHNVVMVYDADDAGQLATLRTLDIFIEEGMEVRVVSLPEGFDPDLFVRKHGIENFKEKVNQAENLFDYKLKVLKSRFHDGHNIEEKVKIASEMLLTINKFKNAVLKSEYIKRLAQNLDLEEGALLQELKKVKEDRPYSNLEKKAQQKPNINPTEKLLIKLMLEEKEFINRIKKSLEPADFQDERACRIISIIFDLMAQGKNIEPYNLINYFEDEDISQVVCETTLSPEIAQENKEKIVDECIQRIKSSRLLVKRQRLQEEIKIAENLGDEEKLNRLKEEFNYLIKKR
jgi:DNA primase